MNRSRPFSYGRQDSKESNSSFANLRQFRAGCDVPVASTPSESESVERHSDSFAISDRDPCEWSHADSGIVASPRPWSEYGGGAKHDSDTIYKAFSDMATWSPPSDISVMSVLDVVSSLRYIGMKEKVVCRFYEEQIDGKQLRELDESLLKEGFPELNSLERKKIMDFVRGWRPKK